MPPGPLNVADRTFRTGGTELPYEIRIIGGGVTFVALWSDGGSSGWVQKGHGGNGGWGSTFVVSKKMKKGRWGYCSATVLVKKG
ncbi:hypothetical protein GYH30_012655 [Glycine max]|nr:hypothetical protein GYH30_012655 [Glycine max]